MTKFNIKATDWLAERDEATQKHQFNRFHGGIGPALEISADYVHLPTSGPDAEGVFSFVIPAALDDF